MNEVKIQLNETLPAKLSTLPESWIERIFSRMSSLYGSLFRDRWRDCDLVEVKRVWAEELASFTDNPECFGLALKALIDDCKFPPTLPEFVAICRKSYRRPTEAVAAIEHKLTPEEMDLHRERVSAMAELIGRKGAA